MKDMQAFVLLDLLPFMDVFYANSTLLLLLLLLLLFELLSWNLGNLAAFQSLIHVL